AAADYTIDQSLRFEDGDNAYLERSLTSNGNKKTFTLSLWTKRANLQSSGYMTLLVCGDTSTNDGLFWKDDTIYLYFATKTLETTQVFRDPNAWYHLLVSVDTTQSTETNRVKLYVNGEQVTDFSTTQYPVRDDDTMFNDASNAFRIGYHGSGAYPLDGYLAEAYLIDGTALTPASFGETNSATNQWVPIEVTGMTYGTNGFYQKYGGTELADSFEDSANHTAHTVTANGNAHTDTTIKKFGTASAQFDGTDSSLSFGLPTEDWNVGSGDFTIDMWVYLTDATPAYSQYLFTAWDSVTRTNCTFLTWLSGTGSQVVNFRWVAGTNLYSCASSSTLSTGQWYHLAFVRNGSNGRIYINGVQDGTEISNSSTANDTTMTARVGMLSNTPNNNWLEGYIDELRFSKGIARWTTDFTPPTAAYESDQYTKLLLHCDGADDGTTFTDSSDSGGGRHTITANGDVTNTKAQSKIGDSSIIFDGSDSLSVADSSDWDFGSNAWTMEFWFRITSGTAGIFAFGPSAGNIAVSVYHGASTLDVHISNDGTNWD
ncbi:MAG: hypothetical protein QF704_10385, partial [Anaerolineales bacterium]|nr:hypothetical protein [Anaerolineales bacterium]